MGAYFQGGVSLKARVWVDHCPHGDRHERNAAQNGGAIACLSQRHTGCTVHSIGDDTKRYEFIAAVLKRLCYRRLGRADKGVVLRYLERLTGYSRQQVIRLVRRSLDEEALVKRYCAL